MIHRPFRLTEIMIRMNYYKIEPKRIRFVHPYIDKEPTMVLIEGVKGARSRVTVEPPLVLYGKKDNEILEGRRIQYGKRVRKGEKYDGNVIPLCHTHR